MRKKFSLKAMAACALAFSMLVSAAGCSKEDDTTKIAVIVKSQNVEFWDTVFKGAEDAGEELGVQVDTFAPESEAHVDDEIQMLNDAVDNGYDAVVIAPINGTDFNDAINSAVEKGVQVITIDTRSQTDVTYIGTDNTAAGGIVGREAKKLLNGSGQIAVVALTDVSTTSVERAQGFIDAVTADGDGVKGEIVETTYCNSDSSVAKEQALELMEKYPDLEMIYGVNQSAAEGICEAVAEKGAAGQIKVIGFDSSETEIQYIKDGVLNGIAVQNPYNMGYMGVQNAISLINGETISSVIDTGATYVSLNNLENAEVQLLLYPFGN